MKVAVVGSRTYPRMGLVVDFVNGLDSWAIVVSGGARGVDRIAEKTAKARDLTTIILEAEWDLLGKRAGPARNLRLVNESDVVVAFWDGKSRGTKHCFTYAKQQGKLQAVFGPDGKVMQV